MNRRRKRFDTKLRPSDVGGTATAKKCDDDILDFSDRPRHDRPILYRRYFYAGNTCELHQRAGSQMTIVAKFDNPEDAIFARDAFNELERRFASYNQELVAA